MTFEVLIEDVGWHVKTAEIHPIQLAVYRSEDVTKRVRNFQKEGITRLTANPKNFSK